jgi:hypothetical protein
MNLNHQTSERPRGIPRSPGAVGRARVSPALASAATLFLTDLAKIGGAVLFQGSVIVTLCDRGHREIARLLATLFPMPAPIEWLLIGGQS